MSSQPPPPPPSGPWSNPPAGPPSGPPAGPPSGPPSGPWSNPTVAPPSGAPSGPWSNPPASPPPGGGQPPWGGQGGPGGFGGGFGGGQGGGYGAPTPPGKGRRTALLAVVGVLVLALIGGVTTLVLVAPWKDSDSSASGGDGKGDGDKGDGGKDGKGDGGKAVDQVAGDLDGDGLGDVRFDIEDGDFDTLRRITGISNGNGFKATEEVASNNFTDPLLVDTAEDEALQIITWKQGENGKSAQFTWSDASFPPIEPVQLAGTDPYSTFSALSGDFDGDGNGDLMVISPSDQPASSDFIVLRGQKGHTFAEPKTWFTLPNAPVRNVRDAVAGDLNGDGADDVFAAVPSERVDPAAKSYVGDTGYIVLTAGDETFEAGAVMVDSEFRDAYLVGDVLGDGRDHLVGITKNFRNDNLDVQVLDISGSSIRAVDAAVANAPVGRRRLASGVLSDVDGDGKSDFVFILRSSSDPGLPGVQVMKANGSGFESPLVWAEIAPCKETYCQVSILGGQD